MLRNATPRSLLIIDEFGKGTDSNDGAGLFCGVIEFLLGLGRDTVSFFQISLTESSLPCLFLIASSCCRYSLPRFVSPTSNEIAKTDLQIRTKLFSQTVSCHAHFPFTSLIWKYSFTNRLRPSSSLPVLLIERVQTHLQSEVQFHKVSKL